MIIKAQGQLPSAGLAQRPAVVATSPLNNLVAQSNAWHSAGVCRAYVEVEQLGTQQQQAPRRPPIPPPPPPPLGAPKVQGHHVHRRSLEAENVVC